MLVSTPRGARTSVSPVRPFALLVLALLAALLALPAASPAATPKILKKAKIAAPLGGTVRGTLSGSKCLIRFPKNPTKLKVTVTGPLSVKKPKTKALKHRGKKKVVCTWKTTSFTDGQYRLTVSARQKIGKKTYKLTLKRNVTVRNKVTAAVTGNNAIPEGPPLGAGNARFVARLSTNWDSWVSAATTDATRRSFMRQHFWGIVSTTPFFDAYTSWAPPTLVYKDLYAIYKDDPATVNAHPDWILKDTSGNPLYIDWNCENGSCPQYAGDLGSPAFRQTWIDQAKAALAKGYTGLWIDDANMEMRIGNGAGTTTVPVDPRTGKPMTFLNWRKYVAEFLAEIRQQIPNTQLVANVLWFGGTAVGRDADPYVQKAYTTVDRLNLERGFNDDGLTAGSAPRDLWAVDTFMEFIDRMHDRGIPITYDSAGSGQDAWEYNLAGFFLVDNGADAVGEMQLPPGQWWNGWDVRLGSPLGDRDRRTDGVFERKFQKGLVLLNPSRAATKTVKLPATYKRINGSKVTSVTLAGGRGAVLLTP